MHTLVGGSFALSHLPSSVTPQLNLLIAPNQVTLIHAMITLNALGYRGEAKEDGVASSNDNMGEGDDDPFPAFKLYYAPNSDPDEVEDMAGNLAEEGRPAEGATLAANVNQWLHLRSTELVVRSPYVAEPPSVDMIFGESFSR